MSKSGIRLAIRYGYVPCQLGLCGPGTKTTKQIITRYLKGDDSLEKKVRKILEDFKGAFSYFKLIAASNGIADPLELKVVEAYWTGNSLLSKVSSDKFSKMMEKEFLPLGKMSEIKIKKLPKNAIPFHTLHVLFIGSVTGKFEATKKGLDICRPSWGKVEKIFKNKITVIRQPIKFGNKLALDKPARTVVSWNKYILPKIEINDWISIHWNTAIEALSPEKIKNISKYTQKTLEIINQK